MIRLLPPFAGTVASDIASGAGFSVNCSPRSQQFTDVGVAFREGSDDIVAKRWYERVDVERPENFARPARDFVGADAVVVSSSSSSSLSLLGQSRQRSGQALSRGYCYVLGYKRDYHSFAQP